MRFHQACQRCRSIVSCTNVPKSHNKVNTYPESRTRTRTVTTTVEGVWIFHRHGDRTPARSLVPTEHLEAEKSFWISKIPSGMTFFDTLCQQFPVQIHESNNQGQFFDVHGGKEPYGFLTFRGMEQMKLLGKNMARRYHRHDESQTSDTSSSSSSSSFLQQWNIQAYSTNYLRTVKSVQCFLDGLLSNKDTTTPFIDPGPTIHVRERSQDILNAFDRQPQLMKKLVQDVVSKESFISYDEKLKPIAQRLIMILPGLAKAANYGGPSGINWIHASDHFVCREAHDLHLSSFSLFHNDHEMDKLLASLRVDTLSHLAWRFRQWYQSPSLLAAIVLAPLREIEMQMKGQVNRLKSNLKDHKPFIIYSCHDVTLLSLLYGIGADFVATEDELQEVAAPTRRDNGEERWKYWPEYATSLIFELVRDDDDEYFVEIFLNGKPIQLISQLQRNGPSKERIDRKIKLDEFTNIINDVENKSHIHAKIEDDQVARDMSTWTG